ncbi:MAG: hypothetical protein KF819_21300 [Labilithrix sp.]|nr:hypothetical protein [Labilithrix sp.]
MRPLLLFLSALPLAACIASPQEPVAYEAVATARGASTIEVDGWSVTVTRAEVALGPFYFCAASSGSSTLCAAAIAELRNVTVVDALDPSPASLGTVRGYSGAIRSAAYDFGISWFETQSAATPSPILPARRSMRLEAEARKAGARVAIVADVDVVPQYQGQNAVPTAPAIADVTSSATRLEVTLDPAGWMRQLDFDAIAASGQVPFTIAPGTAEHTALLVGIKNLAPPELRWVPASTP